MGNSLATFDEEVFDFSNASSSLKKIIQSGELEIILSDNQLNPPEDDIHSIPFK